MKKILITGAESFIGTSFSSYISRWPERYQVDTADMRDGNWREKSFSGYDAVYHVAGIAHVDSRKIDEEKRRQYYAINTDLTIETAKKAKAEGAGQFVFMSSSIVYGDSAPVGKQRIITADTPCSPSNYYGDSKLRAENGLRALEDESFRVVIIRAPMIYGKNCKGNYPALSRIAKMVPVFPYVKNQRSMLYIENLCEFVRLMVENRERGIFWPQNQEYSNTAELVKQIAEAHGRHVVLIKGCTWMLKLLSCCTGLVNKAFGSLCYAQELSEYKEAYRLISLEASVKQTEEQDV